MTEILLLEQRCRNTIRLGESHFREFKSALEGPPDKKKPRRPASICSDIGEALVAFANADGGELLIGVEDDGTVTGVPHGPEEIELMLRAPMTHVLSGQELPITLTEKVFLEGKMALFFAVQKSATRIYQISDGGCVRRMDRATMPIDIQAITFDRQEERSRGYDREFVDGAGIADLDLDLLQAFTSSELHGRSAELYLQQSGLWVYGRGSLRLSMAALLLFARDVRRWHPRCEVRILRVRGTELRAGAAFNVTFDETVVGNIARLATEAWKRLSTHLVTRTELGGDARFEQRYLYPEEACREALLNALAHRDYGIQSPIEVFIFDDRMEIKSPGALLSTVDIEALRARGGAHEPRNPLITRVLRESNFAREIGDGMKRVFKSCEENEQEPPELASNGGSFSITLRRGAIVKVRPRRGARSRGAPAAGVPHVRPRRQSC